MTEQTPGQVDAAAPPPEMAAAEAADRRLMRETEAEIEAERLREENERLKARLEQAAGTGDEPPAEPNHGVELNDPRFPPNHPRNTPGNVAYKIAARERALREKNAQAAAAYGQVDHNGHPAGYDPERRAAEALERVRARREAEQARREQIAESLHDPEERRRLEQEQAARQRIQWRQSMSEKNAIVRKQMKEQGQARPVGP